MEQRVSFITVGVADLDRAMAFYAALGWTPSKYGEGLGVAFYQLPGQVFALYPWAELSRDAGLEPSAAGSISRLSLSYNARSVADAEAVIDRARQAGARVMKEAETVFWGGHVGYFADPDGTLWEVAYNPDAQIREDGTVVLPR